MSERCLDELFVKALHVHDVKDHTDGGKKKNNDER